MTTELTTEMKLCTIVPRHRHLLDPREVPRPHRGRVLGDGRGEHLRRREGRQAAQGHGEPVAR